MGHLGLLAQVHILVTLHSIKLTEKKHLKPITNQIKY